MNVFSVIEEKWTRFCEKARPALQSAGRILGQVGEVLKTIGSYLYRMRAALLSIPVAVAAIYMALLNTARLPKTVGIWIQTDGSFLMLVPRNLAVIAPLAVTALCVLLMLMSKKVTFPWLISLFSLVLPVLIYVTNLFPA